MEKLKTYIPTLKSRWWTGLLGLSLMANLLVGGILIGRNFRHNMLEDSVQNSLAQFVPRKFVEDLPRDRRKEIMGILRENRQDMHALRQDFDSKALQLADALDVENYDATAVKTLIENFTTGSQSLAARGAAVVVELVGKLTPAERKDLAVAIRDKGHGQWRK